MNLRELRAHTRARLDDEAGKRLWSDPAIDAGINAAYVETAERALLLEDAIELTFEAGTDSLMLRDALDIQRVIDSRGKPLVMTSKTSLDHQHPGWELRRSTAPIYAIFREGRLRISPVPEVAVTVRVDYWRLPRAPLQADTDEPEIHRRHHIRMLDWALHLLYDRRDSDGNEDARAETYKSRFEESFGYRPDANVQRKQAEHAEHVTYGNSTW